MTVLSLVIVLLFGGCTNASPILKGTYQSERIEETGYIVVISFDDSNRFIEYIDGREVDRGTYEKTKDNRYNMKSDIQNFEILLNDENSFEIVIKKINDGKPIQLKNLSDIPSEFSIKYDDADDYKALLD